MVNNFNEAEEVDAAVCMVIDHVMKSLDLDAVTIGNKELTAKRAGLYRKVANELLLLARYLDREIGA